MKLKFLATGQAPDHYSFDGDTITATLGEVTESIDLSALEQGDKFEGVEPETLALPGSQAIRDAYRDESGVLHLTLCQASPLGDWRESVEIDSTEYVAGRIYIRELRDGVLLDAPTYDEVIDEA